MSGTDTTKKGWPETLSRIQTALNLTVLVIITVGTELTIRWNKLEDVYSVRPASQMVPLIVSVCIVLGVLFGLFAPEAWRTTDRSQRRAPGQAADLSMYSGVNKDSS